MENALVSVIVPIYGVEEYLPACIESVQRQTYQNLQILLVDDGSPDACGEICDRYAENDPRIQVIHQPNGGVCAARNAGLKAAKGVYICFLDGDDMMKENLVCRAVEEMASGGYDLCSWGTEVRDGDRSFYVGRRKKMRFQFRNERETAKFLCRWFFTARTGWEVGRRIFRRSVIEQFGICFGDAVFAEDMDFTFRYLLHCKSYLFFPEPLYIYHVRSSSVMRTIDRQKQVSQFLSVLQRQKAELSEIMPLRLFYLYEAVALSQFMGEPEPGESPEEKVFATAALLKNCDGWESLLQDAEKMAENQAAVRAVCGQPYRALANAFFQFLLDGNEKRYLKKSRIYFRYLALRRIKQHLLGRKNG